MAGLGSLADLLKNIPGLSSGPKTLYDQNGFLKWQGSAANNYAAVTRDQWKNYIEKGFPIEDALIGFINNADGSVTQAGIEDATNMTKKAVNTSIADSQRRLKSYGLKPTKDEAMVNNRLNNMTMTASLVDARNNTRRAIQELKNQALIGGAPNDGLTTV